MFEHLRKASFAGVSFEVETGSLTFGRRVVTHEYPQRDTPYTEDLGRAARLYSLTGFVIGSDYISHAKRLIKALEKNASEPSKLIHPWLGTVSVCVSDKPKVSWDTARRIARFEMSFVEAGELNNPLDLTSWGDKLRGYADKIMDQALSSLGVSWDDIEDLQTKLDNIADGSFQDILGCLSDSKFSKLLNLGETLSAIAGDAKALLSKNASSFGMTLISAIGLGSISDTTRSWKDLSLASANVLTDKSSSALYTQTKERERLIALGYEPSDEVTAGAALETFVRANMIANIGGAVANIGTDNDLTESSIVNSGMPDLETLQGDLLDAIENEMLTEGTDDNDQYETMAALYDSVYHYLNDEVTGHTSSITLTPREVTPAVVLAYEQYGDANRADEIAQRNGIHNPLFVPPKALSVLDS